MIYEPLRKALLVATKLRTDDFRQWITNELHGYGDSKVPAYRTAQADLRAKNPYHGLIPFVIQINASLHFILNVELRESIGNYVHLLDSSHGMLVVQLSQAELSLLMSGQRFPLEPVRIIGRNKLASVIDTVRTTVLEWALKLEAEGIVGQGMTFSEEEKRKAAISTEIHITNFQGVLGDVADSIVTQNLQMTVRQGDFASLRTYLETQGVETSDIDELERAVKSDPPPTTRGKFGSSVSDWIGEMVTKAASGASQLAIGTVGSLLAQAIWVYYGL